VQQQNGMFDLNERVAIVTGAARGLGYAYSEVLASHGARVVMNDIDADAVETAAGQLKAQGLDVTADVLDVADHESLKQQIDGVAERFGRLDIVFANAGLSAGPGPLTAAGAMANVDLERWNAILQVNLTSVFVTLRTAAAHMVPQGFGRLVVTASIAGLRGERMCGYAYAATKAAVANLVRQASIELSPKGVNVNAIAPGPFRTDIGGGRLRDPDIEKEFAKDVPMGRIADPDEIKGLALLLASPASSFISGAVIPVDGGQSAS
jgi:gluconate 5-dehydrogenase